MKFSKGTILALALIAPISFFGCAKQGVDIAAGDKKPVEIKVTFWGAPDEVKVITNIIDKWQDSHPHIIVRLEHQQTI